MSQQASEHPPGPCQGGGLKFGIFMAPQHNPRGNPTLQLERDLELIELADKLGFDEAWVGEHLSNGFETIPSPEEFLAAASQRTARIRLGTGVNSLPYHHPFTLANRLTLLDHLCRGRAMFGFGPGQSVSDAEMMGIDHRGVRDMMIESAEVIIPLLRGETVSRETSWFTLRNARLQLGLYDPERDLDVAVASVFSPTGSKLAGRLGVGLLSLASSDLKGFQTLDESWANLQRHAKENGHVVDRSQWRVLGALHVAETAEKARDEVRTRILTEVTSFPNVVPFVHETGEPEAWISDPDAALEKWTTDGIAPFGGVATIGTPDDAISAITRLVDKTGGMGTFLLYVHNAAPWHATKNSLSLFAEYVIPAFKRVNELRNSSLRTVLDNRIHYSAVRQEAIEQAQRQHATASTRA
jgi:limonene 1,2-monooxygenase